ncbi:MAG TPA: TonB-dependent receptor, partial [Burkholderiaceae bacterium]|nr:TonB-dependent receptor [Burkholderiaceae bacterium]
SLLRRTDAETALPVTIIRSEELIRQGVTTAEQAVNRISANQSGVGVSQSVGASTGGAAQADLRGLGAQSAANKTLVLLNGRRLASSAIVGLEGAVDLNAIPLNSIDRIEVLRDGASAIYGTDAIGGVINFILRRDYTGIELAAEGQWPRDSGGDERRFTALAGWGNLDKDRFNIMGSIDYRKQDVMLAADRDFARTGIIGTGRAAILAGTSGSAFPGDLNGFEPSGPGCAPPGSVPVTNAAGTAFGSCRYDFTHDIDIIPENEQLTGLLRGTLKLGQDHQVSAEYLRAKNTVIARVAAVPSSHIMLATHPHFPAGAPLTDVPNAAGIDEPGGIVNWRQVPAGTRDGESEAINERWVIDFQGAVAGWDYRAGFGNAKNKTTDSVTGGYTNDDTIQAALYAGLINPFGPQTAADQAALDSALVNARTITSKGDVDFIDARVTKDLFQLPAGPLSIALGTEYRNEKYTYVAEEITRQVPSIGVDPDSDVQGKRHVTALFAEVGIPIVKNLDATVALRYDDYSDVGSTTNPKFTLRFQPVPELLLRASYNTGFRAPTLYDIFSPASLTFTSDSYDDPLLCPGGTALDPSQDGVVCGQQVQSRTGGPVSIGLPASTLQPEESRAWTFGFIVEPAQWLTAGLDFWWIRLENQIGGLPEQAIFADPVKYANKFVRCSQATQAQRNAIDACLNFPTFDPIAFIDQPTENLGNLNTNGIDVNLQVRFTPTPYGKFGLTMDGTYVTKYEYQREKNGAYIQNVGVYADTAPIFRWQHTVSLNYSFGPWSAAFVNRYKSGYADQTAPNEVGSYSVFDLFGTWTGYKGVTLTAGVKNLFDEDPPLTNQVTVFQRGYDPRFTDPRGRTLMLRAAYKFF